MDQKLRIEKVKKLINLNELIIFCKEVKAFLSEDNIKNQNDYASNYRFKSFIDSKMEKYILESDIIVRELCFPLVLKSEHRYHISRKELQDNYLYLYEESENGGMALNLTTGETEKEITL